MCVCACFVGSITCVQGFSLLDFFHGVHVFSVSCIDVELAHKEFRLIEHFYLKALRLPPATFTVTGFLAAVLLALQHYDRLDG